MGLNLPADRNTTYTSASPLLANDLNDIQDQIISLAAGGFDTPAMMRWGAGNASSNTVGATVAYSINAATGDCWFDMVPGTAYVRIDCSGLREGDELTAIGYRARAPGNCSADIRFWSKTAAGAAPVQVGTTMSFITPGGGGFADGNPPQTTLATPLRITAAMEVYAIAAVNSGQMYLMSICGLVSHPPEL